MRLTSMVRLVIEEVLKDVRYALLLRLPAGGLVTVQNVEILVIVLRNDGFEANILKDASACKFGQIIVDDSIKTIGMIALASQAPQPEPVGREQMIEGAMKAAEKDPNRTPICFVRQFEGG